MHNSDPERPRPDGSPVQHHSRPNACLQTLSVVLLCISILCAISTGVLAREDEDAFSLTADITRWYPDQKVSATGHVELKYRGYTITSDALEADLQANTALFKGAVLLTTPQNEIVKGMGLRLNLKTRTWDVQDAKTRIDPAVFKGATTGPAFLQGAAVSGKRDSMMVKSGTLTTCDQDDPHYTFEAKELDIYPESKIVARRVSVIAMGKKVLSLGTLLIPINGTTRNFLPDIGSNTEEGAYMKTSYAYLATAKSQGFLKLDLMQKRGIGTGIDQSYKSGTAVGEANLYFLADRQTGGNDITGRFQHQQKLGGLNLNFTSNYQSNNYLYYPNTTTRNWQLALTHASARANTDLTFRNDGSSGYSTYSNLTTSLRHMQQFGGNLSGVFSMDMRSYNSSMLATPDKELQSNVELRSRQKAYDLSLVTSKWTNLASVGDQGNAFHSGVDRLPELTFDTDSYRVGSRYFLGIPSRLSVTAGQYNEFPAGTSDGRLLVSWDSLQKPFDLNKANELDLRAGLSQALYSSGTAQYVLRGGGVLSSRFGDYTKTRLSYDYQRAEGYSPFLFDYTGQNNVIRAVTDYQCQSKLRWSLSSGYNFGYKTVTWQDLTLRLTSHPNSAYGFSVGTAYNLNAPRDKWQNLIGQLQINAPNRVSLDIGITYDLNQDRLNLGRSQIDLHLGKLWRLQGITSWDGSQQRFDYRAIRLTRDLHCCEASITYIDELGYQENRGVSFSLRIKALPFQDRFGYTQTGQRVDTSMGQYYY